MADRPGGVDAAAAVAVVLADGPLAYGGDHVVAEARRTRLAEEAGWQVVRVWECEVRDDLPPVVTRTMQFPASSNT